MKRSKQNLSHYHLTTGDLGQLLPVGNVEVMPGDAFRHQTSCLVRLTPQVKPLMHPVSVRLHHFYVPYRLLWSGWEDFITGVSATAPPTIGPTAHVEGKLSDYLGNYFDASNDMNALHIRAYNMIYNEFYRDKDLISEVSEDTNDIQKIAWAKDYFTTARSSPQQGSAVTLPLGTTAPVLGIGLANGFIGASASKDFRESDQTSGYTTADGWVSDPSGGSAGSARVNIEEGSTAGYPNIRADLSNASSATIAELREAFALQKYAEARNIYGSSYVDYLRYVGVNPSDGRLSRPEYLGGGTQRVSFSEVLDTGSSATAVGEMRGHGIAAMRSNRYQRFFEEHGVVMTMLSVRPKSIYVNAAPRKFNKTTKEDYYQHELANIGDQEVLNKEVYAAHTTPDGTFGYAPRYDEYRSEPSYVSSEMRNSTNYDFHLGRIFSSDPALNQTFVECSPTKRCFEDQVEDSMWIMVNHDIKARRPIKDRAGYGSL
jgi:hypothetical protein